jgi:hypothetical protein
MMTDAARCAGCGKRDKSVQVIAEHTRYCPDYHSLFARDPAAAIEPAAEYRRWAAEDRAGERAQHREDVIAEADGRREAQREMLSAPDILEDDEVDAREAMYSAWEMIDGQFADASGSAGTADG